jgi:hypothetical protein
MVGARANWATERMSECARKAGVAPTTSWWIGLSRAAFADRARGEANRMRTEQVPACVQRVLDSLENERLALDFEGYQATTLPPRRVPRPRLRRRTRRRFPCSHC